MVSSLETGDCWEIRGEKRGDDALEDYGKAKEWECRKKLGGARKP